MTPRPEDAPAAIAATPAALRATAVATTAAACSPPGDQSTSTPTTTDAKWGQIRPSRWGQAKSSFSPRYRRAVRTPGGSPQRGPEGGSRRSTTPGPVLKAGEALLEEPLSPLRHDITPTPQLRGDLIVPHPLSGHQHHLSSHHLPIRQRTRTRERHQHRTLLVAQIDPIGAIPRHQRPFTRRQDATHATARIGR